MKRTSFIWLVILIAAGVAVLPSQAQDQSLGSYARTVRKDKPAQAPAAKKYDNDNLPKNDKLSVVGNAPEEPAAAATGDQAAANGETKAEAKATGPDQKAVDEWKKKMAAQKDQIDLASRELDVTQREYRLRAAAFYADAGNRLRNKGSWDQEDAQYKQQIATRQKALDAAKQQLSDMQEEARKSGIPASARQ